MGGHHSKHNTFLHAVKVATDEIHTGVVAVVTTVEKVADPIGTIEAASRHPTKTNVLMAVLACAVTAGILALPGADTAVLDDAAETAASLGFQTAESQCGVASIAAAGSRMIIPVFQAMDIDSAAIARFCFRSLDGFLERVSMDDMTQAIAESNETTIDDFADPFSDEAYSGYYSRVDYTDFEDSNPSLVATRNQPPLSARIATAARTGLNSAAALSESETVQVILQYSAITRKVLIAIESATVLNTVACSPSYTATDPKSVGAPTPINSTGSMSSQRANTVMLDHTGRSVHNRAFNVNDYKSCNSAPPSVTNNHLKAFAAKYGLNTI